MPHQVVVVLNGADDDVAAAAPGLDVELVASPGNLGFGAACNLGVERGPRAEFVALVHDDALVGERWLSTLVDAARRSPATGLVGSRGAALFSDATTAVLAPGEPAAEAPVDYCSSCALIVRREAWDAVGGMDEALFPAGYGDVALALRLRSAGWDVRCEPAAAVEHAAGGSLPGNYRAWLHARNRERFIATWGPVLAEQEPPGPDAVARALARAARRPLRSRMATPEPQPPRVESDEQRALRFARLELALQRAYITSHDAALQDAREETMRVSETLHAELRRVHARAAAEIAARDNELRKARGELE